MSATWNITLERRIDEGQFDSVCSELGLLRNGNTAYDVRVTGTKVLDDLGINGVEVHYGKGTRNDPLVIRSCAGELRYEAMKRTALDLAEKLPFRTISGEWFDEVSKKPLPYSADVFKQLE